MKRLLYIAAIGLTAAAAACSHSGDTRPAADTPPAATSPDFESVYADSTSQWEFGDSVAPAKGVPFSRMRHIAGLDKVFNDSNYVQWATGEKLGIEPVADTRGHWATRRPLVRIASNRYVYVEPMTFSKPYLVPEAAALINEIGRRFHDTIEARGGGDYRIRVTSALRTVDNVRRLRRHNSNAIDSSVHKLGTTFDISYARFVRDNQQCTPRSSADLKAILAEVLLDLRTEGRCWVKYEIKQPCFHITARPN